MLLCHTYVQSVELADLYGFPPGNVYVRSCTQTMQARNMLCVLVSYVRTVSRACRFIRLPPGQRVCQVMHTDHAGQEHVVCLPCWWKDKKQRCSNNISAVWARQQEAPNLSKPEIITSIATPSVNDYLVGYFIGFGAEFTTAADFSYRVSTGSVLQKVSLFFYLTLGFSHPCVRCLQCCLYPT